MPTKTKRSSSKSKSVSRVKKLETKMNQEKRKALSSTLKLNKIRKDLAKAIKGEIKTLQANPGKSKAKQQKIRSLNKISNQCKKSFSFKAA